MSDPSFSLLQRQMVEIIAVHAFGAREQIGKHRLEQRVLDAMAQIPRHEFVPLEIAPFAYADQPLPIGYDKTISQPFIVALMTDILDVGSEDTVLEIGTGLGYHTAVLARLAKAVYSIEIVEELAEQASKRLAQHGVRNVTLRIGNGEHGWAAHAPFDRILVCAGTELILPSLLMQLKAGGRMVAPAGMPDQQVLTLIEKNAEGRLRTKEVLPVRFAMMEQNEAP